jgi:hypothetical protein
MSPQATELMQSFAGRFRESEKRPRATLQNECAVLSRTEGSTNLSGTNLNVA